MKSKDSISIYWAPVFFNSENLDDNTDWSILYPDPVCLYDDLLEHKNKENKNVNFMTCPASRSIFTNTYVLKNTIESEYQYTVDNDVTLIKPISKHYLGSSSDRPKSLNIGPIISLRMGYIFFSDESILATFLPPYFHKPNYLNNGAILPGEFDIGKWFRPYMAEFQCWSNDGTFSIKNDEPILYVRFNTDKKINLKKFTYTKKLSKIVDTNIRARYFYKTNALLSSYYNLFKRAKMKNIILDEINKNLVGDYNDREI